MPIQINLLHYKFVFEEMQWRKEFNIKIQPGKDRLRSLLAHALSEVSGLKITSSDEALRIFEAIPSAIIYRIFIIYKSGLAEPRLFKTLGLYRAPEAAYFSRRVDEGEQAREQVMDRAEEEMVAKFGRKELSEARKQEMQMLRNSKGRGLTKASKDTGLGPAFPPINTNTPSAGIPPAVLDAALKPPSKPILPPFRKRK